jgi:hypothetical protein
VPTQAPDVKVDKVPRVKRSIDPPPKTRDFSLPALRGSFVGRERRS